MTIAATPFTMGFDTVGLHLQDFIAKITESTVATQASAMEATTFYDNYTHLSDLFITLADTSLQAAGALPEAIRTRQNLVFEVAKNHTLEYIYEQLKSLLLDKKVDSIDHAAASSDLLEECTIFSATFVRLHNISVEASGEIDEEIRLVKKSTFSEQLGLALRELDDLIMGHAHQVSELEAQLEAFQHAYHNDFYPD